MIAESREYGVFLRNDEGETIFDRILARSEGYAADMLEKRHRGFTAYRVSCCWEIIGRCSVCKQFVFAGERGEQIGPDVRCFDCA